MTANNGSATEVETIKADLMALRGDMSALSKTLYKGGVKKAKAVRDATGQCITEATESVEEFVRDRPFTTLAIAFGAGAFASTLAWTLLRRR